MSNKRPTGELDHWTKTPHGRLALILLLDQFRRNIYRGLAEAYEQDPKALKLCVEGAMRKGDKGLTPIQRVFFYMPLQHAESRKVQAKSVDIYNRLAEAVSPDTDGNLSDGCPVCRTAPRHHRAVRPVSAPQPGSRPGKHGGRRSLPGGRRGVLRPGVGRQHRSRPVAIAELSLRATTSPAAPAIRAGNARSGESLPRLSPARSHPRYRTAESCRP